MCKESDKNKEKVHWMTKVTFWVAMTLLILCSLGIIIPYLNISPDNIIIAFIGVLATFVVINNYTQIVDVKNKLAGEIKSLNGEIKSLNNDVKDLKVQNDRLEKGVSDLTKTSIALVLKNINRPKGFSVSDIIDYSLIDNGVYYAHARIINCNNETEIMAFKVDIFKLVAILVEEK